MKALEKDRTRRYDTPGSVARDVERYLAGDAVEAGPPSARYKLAKFARRHRWPLATAAAFAVMLVAATAGSTYLATSCSCGGRAGEGSIETDDLGRGRKEPRAWMRPPGPRRRPIGHPRIRSITGQGTGGEQVSGRVVPKARPESGRANAQGGRPARSGGGQPGPAFCRLATRQDRTPRCDRDDLPGAGPTESGGGRILEGWRRTRGGARCRARRDAHQPPQPRRCLCADGPSLGRDQDS